MTVCCLLCNTEQKMYYGLWYCPKCKNIPKEYKIMVKLAKKEVFDDIEKCNPNLYWNELKPTQDYALHLVGILVATLTVLAIFKYWVIDSSNLLKNGVGIIMMVIWIAVLIREVLINGG